MSGICGAYGKGEIEEMTRVLAHRGPDDMGFYLEGPLQLGVRRLSIMDLPGGHQPVTSEREDVWVMLDGEIFNFEELRAELTSAGHEFHTHTDTEVIAHAWEEWGPAALSRFNGQFAIAVWDGKLHLARDRIGEKPLYYYQRGPRLLFASEIKSLLTQVEAAPRFTDEFRDFETPAPGDTLFQNIKELPPGHRLVFDGKRLELHAWWDLPDYNGPYETDAHYVEQLRWLLADSVALRLKGDVPVGVFLSGGLDSAIIACLAKPEHAYAVSFPDEGRAYDELEWAKLVAKHIKAKLHLVSPQAKDLREMLPSIIWHLDQPVASMSSLALFMLAREASKKVKAVLVGQGADELFGGYVRHLMMLAEDRLGSEPALRGYLPLARFFWNREMFAEPAERYYTIINRGPSRDPKCRRLIRDHFERHTHLIDKMGATDLRLTLPSVLHMDDRATAAFGIENRNPFLDHRIVEFAFRLPPHLKISGFDNKVILRQALQDIVPEPVLARRDKIGLVVPLGHWLKKDLKRWAEVRVKRFYERYEANFLNAAWDAAGDRGEFDRKAYMRLCLELWMEIMVKKETDGWDQFRLARGSKKA